MNNFITFQEAYDIVKCINLKSTHEWREWIKKNKKFNIPYNPDIYYKNDGWISWNHFLNKDFKIDFLPYIDSVKIIKNLKFKNNIEFKKWIKDNSKKFRIPRAPEITYKDKGWVSWGEFLNTNNVYSKKFISYEEATIILHKLNLKSQKEYLSYIKIKKIDLPYNPQVIYKKEWISWGVYLNSGRISNSKKDFLNYNEARKIVHKKNLKSAQEFIKWNRPDCIPSNPSIRYKEFWISWGDFLGTNNKSLKEKGTSFLSFEEAKLYISNLNLKHKFEYMEYIEKNHIDFLPKRPDYIYKDKWTGYLDYLNCEGLRSSYGERKIKDFLDTLGIQYKREYKFETCINDEENKLPFDFYIPERNLCIEYDGQHHFNVVSKYGGDIFLEKVKKHDKIKDDWCLKNNIKLIRISYRQKRKITKILNELFN